MIERIKALMLQNNVTATKLTTELQLPRSAITEWSKGKAKPSTEAIVKIAKYFGVSTDYLLTGKEYNTQSLIVQSGNGIFGNTGNVENSSVSINTENTGEKQTATTQNNVQQLTEEESEILRIYRSLSVKDRAELLLKICNYDKNE